MIRTTSTKTSMTPTEHTDALVKAILTPGPLGIALMGALVENVTVDEAPYVDPAAPYGYAPCRSCGYERALGSGPCGEPCV